MWIWRLLFIFMMRPLVAQSLGLLPDLHGFARVGEEREEHEEIGVKSKGKTQDTNAHNTITSEFAPLGSKDQVQWNPERETVTQNHSERDRKTRGRIQIVGKSSNQVESQRERLRATRVRYLERHHALEVLANLFGWVSLRGVVGIAKSHGISQVISYLFSTQN